MYHRYLDPKLRESLEESPVVLINGARQAGKSTLVQTLLSKTHTYYTLDDYTILSVIKSDPYNFLVSQKNPIIIDEIQRAPEAFIALKRIVDERRDPGRFVLTGSANILMLPKLSDSLAGRMEVLTLWPLSSAEIFVGASQLVADLLSCAFLEFVPPVLDDDDYIQNILIGGYPEVVRRSTLSKRSNWFKGYIQTLLTRDVQDLAGIERVAQLPILLNILAARAGGLLNVSELSRSSQIPLTTLNRYLKIFEMLYLTVCLQPWHSNIGKRFVKSPKLYLSDVGLLSFLLGMSEDHILQRPDLWGHILENFVVMEFIKHQSWSNIRFNVYHYRTENNEEIDLILETDQGDMLAIEVKASKTIDKRSLKAIKSLQAALPHKTIKGFVVYMGDKVLPLAQDIWALPLSYFMQPRKKNMIQEQFQKFVLHHNQFDEIYQKEIHLILQGRKADELIPSYLISSSELLSIAKEYINIIQDIPDDKLSNKVKLLEALNYCNNNLLPKDPTPRTSNLMGNIPVQNIGIFAKNIKDVNKVLKNYFEENLPVQPKNPIGFITS